MVGVALLIYILCVQCCCGLVCMSKRFAVEIIVRGNIEIVVQRRWCIRSGWQNVRRESFIDLLEGSLAIGEGMSSNRSVAESQ